MNNEKDQLRTAALFYHRHPKPGKVSIQPTKQLTNQYDLSMAYSPGVAAACEEIVAFPAEASTLTARANLVGVITNGTAVLGLGAIGPLAAKPVMEGKAVLFKKFANIDVFDLEIEERDPGELFGVGGVRTVPEGVKAWNPVFDVAPSELIDAIVTERGVVERPNRVSMQTFFGH